MKKIRLLFLPLMIIALFSLNSCGSDEPVDGAITNTGGNPDTDGGTSSGDYWPTAVNNQWIFKKNGELQEPLKMVSTNTISGNTYYTFNQQFVVRSGVSISAIQHIRKSNGNYYLKTEKLTSPADGIIPGFTTTEYETIVLKDYLPVGGTWEDHYTYKTTYTDPMYPVITLTFDTTGTILEKDSSVTVAGHNYTDVIKIKYVQNVTMAGQASTHTSYYWYAKDIGPVKIVMESADQTTIQELDSYIVKK